MMLAGLVALVAVGAAQAAPDVAVLPAEVRGVVLFPDGETPAERLAVTVWNADTEKIVYRTRTDKNGVFDVPRLEEGNHYVTVGPVRIDMRILTARAGVTPQPHGFVVVIPKRMPIVQTLVPSTLTAAAAALPAAPQVVSP
ncbi:MAG: carboxypeptidase-like regulatory domain-containing protein [Lentisphaerae bacterium]|nr:carboxypeptidase-like regulatory domain-containing protein [Lentisphaerota bacterium]